MGRELAQRAAARNGGTGTDTNTAAVSNGNGAGEQDDRVRTLAGQISRMAPEYKAAMPKGREATQLIRDATTCLRNIRNLDKCEPVTVLGALMTCAQLDLRPGVLGQAWPLPYWDGRDKCYKAQLVIGYQGYIELGHRSGRLKDIVSEIVYVEDREFDFWLDEDGPHLIHKPAIDGVQEKIRCFYSAARLTNGGYQVTRPASALMMQLHRDEYAPRDRNGKVTGPWVKNFGPMGRKTMILRNFHTLPKSAEMAIAMEADEGIRIDLDPTHDAAEVTEHHVVPGEVEADPDTGSQDQTGTPAGEGTSPPDDWPSGENR